MTKVMIRPETKDDIKAIQEVCDQSFGRKAEGLLVDRLRTLEEFEPALSLVADVGGLSVSIQPCQLGNQVRWREDVPGPTL